MTIVLGVAALILLIFARMPVAIAMAVVGVVGFGFLRGWEGSFAQVAQLTTSTVMSYEFSVVPLFVFMGLLVDRAGLSAKLYEASNAFLGHRRGGLAMATIVACGGFSAICGSSVATAVTMAKVAMPSMRRYGYDDRLATGAIAAGGTLGILIPPSLVLVIYGLITESSVGKLFAAGMIPGLIGIAFYLLATWFVVRRDETQGPPTERQPWPARYRHLARVWGVLLLFAIVMGGIYGGLFTATEAAGIGAVAAAVFAVFSGNVSFAGMFEVTFIAVRTTAMLFFIVIGALLFASFLNAAELPSYMLGFVEQLQVSKIVVIILMLCVFLLLGCVLESLSMMLLLVPIFYPLVAQLGFDLIWFGIVTVVVTEISLLTPPVGLNIFVLRGALPDVSTGTIYRGVTPFWCVDIVRLALLIAFPSLSLFLPELIFGT